VVVNYATSRDAAEKVVAGITEAGASRSRCGADFSKADEAREIVVAAVRVRTHRVLDGDAETVARDVSCGHVELAQDRHSRCFRRNRWWAA